MNDDEIVTIPDGDNQPRTSTQDGQIFRLEAGAATTVDGAPVLTIQDDDVSLTVGGTATTTGPAPTVEIGGEDGRLLNTSTGEIASEDTGIAVIDAGSAFIGNRGAISGDVNGVNFANGGETSGRLVTFGTISSDSRAVNIGGDGVVLQNLGSIVGTGDQRNGTIYTDGSADDYVIANFAAGTIDAGAGNQGAGVALQTGDVADDTIEGRIVNLGTIAGRGQGEATSGLAGDGIRIFAGAEGATFEGDIVNAGALTSDSLEGPTAALRIANGVSFDGTINNSASGVIDGANNGLYFGIGDHDVIVNNSGTIQSESRAVNIDGSGVELRNAGDILGVGDQRNGTVYSDATADDYFVLNLRAGTIDAGEGNLGAGIALQTGDVEGDVVNAGIRNNGVVEGRGQGEATSGLAGDGIRVFAGAEDATFAGNIVNAGRISSESAEGPTAGIRIANGINFDGNILNLAGGLIEGENNGVYFGTGTHDAQIQNVGTIKSGSRAVNIDGEGVILINRGEIEGTGDQRNGTVYADGTAEDYRIANLATGVIDAGEGNDGSAVSLQTGDLDGDLVEGRVFNSGTITGRGDATEGNGIGDGVRIFSGFSDATFQGDILNSGTIQASDQVAEAVAIRIQDGVTLNGQIVNEGVLTASSVAIDASDAGGAVEVVNSGAIDGEVVLSAGDDRFAGRESQGSVTVDGKAGDDVIFAGGGDDFLTGGTGNDTLDGGNGFDTAVFTDIDVPVEVALDANGNGTATRETGFAVSVENAPLASLTTDQSADELLDEAVAGNLYFNIHTEAFPGGEIRGQLTVASDETVDGVRTLVISGDLDASQEPDDTSDSLATGVGTVTIVAGPDGVTYSSELSVSGILTSELLPVAGVSSIHLHNAPAGVNGPVVTDIVQDAGGDVNGAATGGDGNVFDETIEVDTLISIEEVIVNGEAVAATDAFIFADGTSDGPITAFDADDDILSLPNGGDVVAAASQTGDDVTIHPGDDGSLTVANSGVGDLTDDYALI